MFFLLLNPLIPPLSIQSLFLCFSLPLLSSASMATAAGSYEGGAGGVFRRRSSRNRPTPYDRPTSGRHALPNPVKPPPTAARATSWFSKLKDPLSRIVHSSYNRFFSLGSRKRLGPAPANSEPLPASRDESPNEVCNGPFAGVQERGSREQGGPNNFSESIGLDELEQLLKQKTFTRAEIDRLTELLRSRTVDSSSADENRKIAPNASEPAANSDVPLQENGANVQRNGWPGSISTPPVHSSVAVPAEISSAAEIAKAYMGTSRVSPSTLGLQSQAFRDDASFQHNAPYAPQSPNLEFAPRSGIRFSSVPRLSEDASLSPKVQGGRSGIHNMVRSPYSRPVQAMSFPEGTTDSYAGPSTSSQWPQAKGVLSGGRQALKRRSSFIDDDFGSIGPIRRIRQKSNMIARRKSIMISPISSDAGPSSSSSTQQLLQLDGPKDSASLIKAAENGDNRFASAGLASVPPQSSVTARKILEQLDIMVPSPKEKSTISKLALAMEKSPAKLMLNMLHGPARRSMEDIDSPNFHYVQGGVFDGQNGSTFLSPESSIARAKDRVVENGVSEPADGLGNAVITATYTPSAKAADSVSLGVDGNPPLSRRPFQMSAPEEFLEDDDDDSSEHISAAENDKLELYQTENKDVAPDIEKQKPPASFSEAKPAANSSSRTGLVKRASVEPIVAGKDFSGFTFPVTNASDALSVPLTPTPLPSPVFGILVQSKEQTGTPLVCFGSTSVSKTPAVPASSTTSLNIETSGFKFGAASELKAEIKNRDATAFLKMPSIPPASSPVTALASPTLPAISQASPPEAAASTPLADTSLDKTNQLRKSGDSLQFSQNGSSSSSSTSASLSIFSGFSASTTSTLVNGLMASTSSMVAVSSASEAPVSSSPYTFFTGSSSSSSLSTAAAAVATVPAAPMFQFGSASAAPSVANSFSPPSTAAAQEPADLAPKDKPSNPLPFGIINSSFPSISSGQFTSTGSSLFGLSTPAISNTNASSITENTSTSNQSQSSVSPFGAIAGSLFGSQTSTASTTISSFTQSAPSQLGSSSSPSFGLSGSSIFGSSSSPSGSSISGSKPFSLSSGFGSTSSVSFSTESGSSPFSTSSNPFSSNSQSSTPSFFTSGFGSTSSPATGFSFGGSSTAVSTSLATGFSFGGSSAAASTSSPAAGFSFGGSSTAGSVSFGAPSTAGNVSFGGSSAGGFPFGSSLSASSGPAFSFTSAASAATQGSLTTAASFGTASPGNDQMNIEDSMAEDTVQAPTLVSPFGMAATSSPSNFVFGSSSVPAGGSSPFQFGAPQNPGAPQAPSPFTRGSSLEFNGGSFSLGSGGGDKANRRIVKIKRDKVRRK